MHAPNKHQELQRPLFGQFAQVVAQIPSIQIRQCLEYQREHGGRLGELLVQRGLLEPQQVYEVLSKAAEWVVATRQADMPDFGFPRPFTLSVCMPCFNEASCIEDCLRAACAILPHFVEQFEVIVVDDGSTDHTAKIVEGYSREDSRVALLRHPQNRGYGAAVTTALKAAEGDYVMFTDGDGQFSLLDVPQLLAHLDRFDYVVGFRHQRAEGGMRVVNAWAWKTLIRMMLGVRIRDLDCAFKLFPRNVVQQLQMSAEGACINAEIMGQLVRSDLKHREVPVMHYPRYEGASSGASLKVIAKAFRELPRLWKYRSIAPLTLPEAAQPDEQSQVAVLEA